MATQPDSITTNKRGYSSASHPHFHPNNCYIVVLKGKWWVGTGPKWDPEHGSVAMPSGSFVTR
jgi:hypothetical protein